MENVTSFYLIQKKNCVNLLLILSNCRKRQSGKKKRHFFSSELGFPVRKNTIHKLAKAYIKTRDRTPSYRVLELPKEDEGRPLLLCKYDKLVQNQN